MHRFTLVLSLLAAPATLSAQWSITLARGNGSGAHDAVETAATDPAEFRADRLRTWSIGVERAIASWRVGIDLRRNDADITELGAESAVVARDALTATAISVGLSRRIAGGGDRVALAIGVAASFQRWVFDVDGGTPAWRTAARGSLEASAPIARHLSGLVRAEYTIGASAFGVDELPEGFEARTARRVELLIGARWMPWVRFEH